VPIARTPRLKQVEGMFDLRPEKVSTFFLKADLPLDHKPWQIGLIVGPSGSGKTTLAHELFGAAVLAGHAWPKDKSILDAFPAALPIKEICGLLCSVGFSSPPAWLRPFHVLSNGEQFRVSVARALAQAATENHDQQPPVVIDEFTSVVDRTVAQIGSAAVAKAVRSRPHLRFVAVSCHYDISDWLQPDWTFDAGAGLFAWRSLQKRPQIALEIFRTRRSTWNLFRRHHYLSDQLAAAAMPFVGLVDGQPATFTAVMSFAHPRRSGWREHRTVCLPDFQGVGLGNAMSELMAGVFASTGKPYRSVTSHPAMIRHRARSPLWKMVRAPSLMIGSNDKGTLKVPSSDGSAKVPRVFRKRIRHCPSSAQLGATYRQSSSALAGRLTATFEYIGPPRPDEARRLGVLKTPAPPRSAATATLA